MPDYSVEIAAIEAQLSEGAKRVRTDGVEVEYDIAALERRLAYLRRMNDDTVLVRPRIATVDLSQS